MAASLVPNFDRWFISTPKQFEHMYRIFHRNIDRLLISALRNGGKRSIMDSAFEESFWMFFTTPDCPILCYQKSPAERRKGDIMQIVTTESISGKELETLGLVRGSTIQTVNAFKDIGSGLKTLVGGELGSYNEMMTKTRDLATDRMVKEAERLGADAIVCVRYSSSSIMQSAAEIMVYGTAVRFK